MSSVSQGRLENRVRDALREREGVEAAYQPFTLGQLVSLRARTHASVIAINVFERGECATYAELDEASNRYAHALRAFGLRKGDRVGVMLPNRIEFPILWFAIAKLGAVIVPINSRYTPREIQFVLNDTDANFAIIDRTAWEAFRAMEPWPANLSKDKVILVGDARGASVVALDALVKGASTSALDEDVSSNDLLNIQFTSGTTGFPKGCMLTHEYWGVSSAHAFLDAEPYARHLSWAPFYYAEGQGQLLRSYRQGGTLYLAETLSSTRFTSWLNEHQIEWCSIPEAIGRDPATAGSAAATLKEIQQYVGWSCDAIRHFRRRSGIPGYNVYGMTEIGWGTRMPIGLEEMDSSDSIGLRALFRELRLVNDDGTDTAGGDIGELWVRGRGIFKGYWNNAEANAAAFEGEWFKTGDLMRRDELGFHWIVGRKKDMIRRSSENIAAREVEAIIREVPDILDVAAVPVRDERRGEEVKIYVELKEGIVGDDALVTRILEHARTRLAVFKVPRYISFISALPRSAASQKVLKRELMEIADPIAGSFDAEANIWH